MKGIMNTWRLNVPPIRGYLSLKKNQINDKFTHNKTEISLNLKPWNKLSIYNVDIDRNKNNKLMA